MLNFSGRKMKGFDKGEKNNYTSAVGIYYAVGIIRGFCVQLFKVGGSGILFRQYIGAFVRERYFRASHRQHFPRGILRAGYEPIYSYDG